MSTLRERLITFNAPRKSRQAEDTEAQKNQKIREEQLSIQRKNDISKLKQLSQGTVLPYFEMVNEIHLDGKGKVEIVDSHFASTDILNFNDIEIGKVRNEVKVELNWGYKASPSGYESGASGFRLSAHLYRLEDRREYIGIFGTRNDVHPGILVDSRKFNNREVKQKLEDTIFELVTYTDACQWSEPLITDLTP